MSDNKQGRITLDETTWGELERVSLQKGTSKSEIIENYINRGLAKEGELSGSERLRHADKVLNLGLDSMLISLNIEVKEGFLRKFEVLFNEIGGLSKQHSLHSRVGMMEVDSFNLLREVESYDKNLFREISKKIKGNMKKRFLNLYPELKT